MKITDARIDGFGVWNAMSVDGLSETITLFYGPNEAGKTTLMQFVRAVLYGFSPDRQKLYFPPVYGGEPGGILRVQNHTGEFVVERRYSETDPDNPGRVIVLAANGSRQGQHLLSVLISGIDESIFNNVFAVGIRELQELATLNDTQAAEQLYNLSSGVDRVSLVEVMRDLSSARTNIWTGDGATGELDRLLAQRDKLATEISDLQRQTRRWSDLATQRRSLLAEVSELEQRIQRLERDARVVELACQVREKWISRDEVTRDIEDLGPLDELPEGCLEQLAATNDQITQQREQTRPLKKRHLEIRRELAAQPINRALWDQSCRIEALCEHAPWLASLDDEIQRLTSDVEGAELALLKHEELAANRGGPALADTHAITPRVLQQLQAPAQGLRETMKSRSIARRVQKKASQQADNVAGEIQEELGGRTVEDFDDALEQAATVVKQLGRSIQVEERLEQTQKQRLDLNEEYQELLDDQLQNVRILAGIGLMFTFGWVLALTGMFGWKVMPIAAEVGWGISILGLICIGLAVAWKTVVERTAREELDVALRRAETVEDEIEQLTDERDSLAEALPPGRGTLSSRLATAEKELKELEDLAPRYLQRQQAQKQKQESRRQTSGTEDELREARSRWRRALRQFGLPESLTPKHVRQLAAHQQEKSKLATTLAEHRSRLEKLQRDRTTLVDRLSQLNEDVGLTIVSSDPQIQLSQLATALSGQREMVVRRRELQREEKGLRRELAQGLRSLRRLTRGRESLFAAARVTDEEEIQQRAAALARLSELQQRHEALSGQIVAIVGSHVGLDDIKQELRQHSKQELEHRWNGLTARLQDAQARRGQFHQRHGEINQEMKSLAENRRLAAANFEWECVQAKLSRATERWRTLAVTSTLLENIRETYEAERQPETLGEASVYLNRLTDGKYTRIWTPLGHNELRIEGDDGQPMSLDVLSRGTREAVFLALRMALVAAYGRRGVNVPMILDDVLVNLDAKRAAAAVEVLHDFSKDGRQLLFFTCHEHIKAMFVAAGVDTRVLPVHGTPGVHVVPLLTQEVPEPEAIQEPEIEEPEVEVIDQVDETPAEIEETVIESEEIPDEEQEPINVEVPTDFDYELQAADEVLKAPQFDLSSFAETHESDSDAEEAEEDQQLENEEAEGEQELEQPIDIEYVFNEAHDDDPFDDGPWWWEGSRRFGIEEEETAA